MPNDKLEDRDRPFLEKLILAADVILKLGEDPGVLNTALESELLLFRESCEGILLRK